MLPGLFQSTTIPCLEQVVDFRPARHTVLAGNIANMDTPGYQARDISVEDFQERLKTAIEDRKILGDVAWRAGLATACAAGRSGEKLAVGAAARSGNVSMEYQAAEMAKNQMQHNLALSLLVSQFRLLQSAISEKV